MSAINTAATMLTNLPTTTSTSSSSAANPYNLQPSDFIQMMVTQLENQDPMNPTSNADLMAQMSDIGQLESSTQMQTTLQSITLQTQIGSASALIGKSIQGIDANNSQASGTVTAVQVAGGQVNLQLDSGDTISLTNVSSITSAATSSTGTSTTTSN